MPKGPVAIIPARFHSTRFPGKPLITIKGMTLLERTYRRVLLCPEITRIIIATDDERIQKCADAFGAEVVMTNPSCPTGTDRLAEVVRNDPSLLNSDAIVNVQGDEPCIEPETISQAIKALFSHDEAVIGTVVAPIHHEDELKNPNVVKCVKTLQGQALYFSRHTIPGSKSQIKLDPNFTYFRHIGMYTYRPDFLPVFASLPPTPLQQIEDLEMLRALEHGYKIGVGVVDRHSPDVNTPEDIERVSLWIERQSFSL